MSWFKCSDLLAVGRVHLEAIGQHLGLLHRHLLLHDGSHVTASAVLALNRRHVVLQHVLIGVALREELLLLRLQLLLVSDVAVLEDPGVSDHGQVFVEFPQFLRCFIDLFAVI